MRRIRVYVDTSVFGGTQDEGFAEPCRRFFERVRAGDYTILVSRITYAELLGAPDGIRSLLAELPRRAVEEVAIGAEVAALADAYLAARALPPSMRNDALHVAAATVAGADVILSWNFRHIVNFERIRRFNGVNLLNGYHQVSIHSPLEMDYDR
ncbi:MAG: PIN domain-containing protein [Phycisphaerae bacterium]